MTSREVRALLLAIDRGAYHAREVRSLSARQRRGAQALALGSLVRLLPRRGRMARRYVLTAAGSHAIGTLDADRDLLREIWECRARLKRAA